MSLAFTCILGGGLGAIRSNASFSASHSIWGTPKVTLFGDFAATLAALEGGKDKNPLPARHNGRRLRRCCLHLQIDLLCILARSHFHCQTCRTRLRTEHSLLESSSSCILWRSGFLSCMCCTSVQMRDSLSARRIFLRHGCVCHNLCIAFFHQLLGIFFRWSDLSDYC